MLQGRAFEVECTLRPALSDAAALEQARAGVRDALNFDDELGELVATLGARSKGQLFQALLEELRSVGVSHAQTDLTPSKARTSSEYADTIGYERWQALATRADALRKLVRIKVADDNDLKTARAGFILCQEFLDGLGELAPMRGVDEFTLLQELSLTTA